MRLKSGVMRWVAIAALSAGAMILSSGVVSPVQAQPSFLQQLNPLNIPSPNLLNQSPNNQEAIGCIRLDGRCLFEIAAPKSQLDERISDIEQRLNQVSNDYFRNEEAQLKVFQQQPEGEGAIPNIYVSVGEQKPVRLMSVTDLDAKLGGDSIEMRAEEIVTQLERQLQRAKEERQPEFLSRQGAVAIGTGAAMLIASLALYHWGKRSKRSKEVLTPSDTSQAQPITTQLNKQHEWNVKEVQHRLFQLAQVGIVGGGTLFILGLFPYTRPIQLLILRSLKIPVKVGLILVVTYVIIRLSYAAIDKFASALANNYLQTPEANRRLRLRLSTISGVTKGIVTVIWVAISILVALSTLGVDIGPVLAGAGIIGVALSLASQSLIKDALNGFFIILEDQYAVGDVITVGDVGGLVETMNLRITQVRDAEGRLITIPNSEIKIVANLSSNWSRADLSIPVAYYTDVNKALELIEKVAEDMSHDSKWREQIVDKPEVLGVDDFGSRGVIIRVWIKTQPLKQWDVARQFRRRLKVALDEAGISIPMPQQEVWFNNSVAMKGSQDGKTASQNH
jgi:small conductance mechanosensitive channel